MRWLAGLYYRRAILLGALLVFCPTANSVAHAQDVLLTVAQEEQYRERQVLDPDSDEWLEPTSAPAGVGELDDARALLAKGETRAARHALEDWIEANPDHERLYEAIWLLGEAHFERPDFYAAYLQYEQVVENSSGELFYKALRREVDVARAFLSGEKRIVWKVLYLPAYQDGIEILDRVWERAPGTRLGEEALKIKADYYYANGDLDLAQDEYVSLAREYPYGRFVRLASLRAAEASAASFPGIPYDDRALLEAETRYEQVQSTYPEYAERERVAERIEGIRQTRADKDLATAKWYEKVGQAGAAEHYYRMIVREWPETLASSEARSRLRALGIEIEATPVGAPAATEDNG